MFTVPTSPVLLDKNEQLLAARIAADQQWRFATPDSVPIRFREAITTFEDKHFDSHMGVHFPSIARALYQNFKNTEVVSGGSTISMQVIRMSRGNPRRTYFEKAKEIIRAFRLETQYSKDEIMLMYATHAPMGGNVVGLEAAAWRYFNCAPHQLTWAETATLAVLPNAPSLMHPGKNREALKSKRNRLLKALHEKGVMDQLTYELSLEERLPEKPKRLPQLAMHLLNKIDRGKGKRSTTSLDVTLQLEAEKIVSRHQKILAENLVHNAAAVIIDVKKQQIVSYIGNMGTPGQGEHVDVLEALRSPGSTLKPFLYAAMLDDGFMTPKQLLRDVPVNFSGFAPKNFDKSYRGVVPADEALARSLNVPAVEMLRTYGVTPFHETLLNCGFRNLNQTSSHYGLSLILGGGEVTPLQLASAYAEMAHTINTYYESNGRYVAQHPCFNHDTRPTETISLKEEPLTFSASSAFHTMEALFKVNRPASEAGWEQLGSSRRIGWKTGTSYGFRDAWAVGCTPEYVVLVWVGNADGVGRPGVIGSQAAAPILFDLFDILPSTTWFHAPEDELVPMGICQQSGHRASRHCTSVDTSYISQNCLEASACPYHQPIFVNANKTLRVDRSCDTNPVAINWFSLPALETWYFKNTHPEHRDIPPWNPDCYSSMNEVDFSILHPLDKATITLPVDMQTGKQPLVMKVANNGKTLHWHLDDLYIGTTQGIHEMQQALSPGKHQLLVVNDDGEIQVSSFQIR